MAAMFNPPKYPQPQRAPAAPTLDTAALREAEDDRQRVKAGSASNYLTNPGRQPTARAAVSHLTESTDDHA